MSKMSDIQVQIQEVETVSKQAVIDAFKVWLIDNNDMRRFEEVVRDLQPVEQIQTCEDAVSRQTVIDILDYWYDKESSDYVNACKSISELPPVTPTRPKGHWDTIIYSNMVGERGLMQDKGLNLFCEHCGADMREGEA